MASPDKPPGPLPLRVLSAALRARLAVPQLRLASDDRPLVEDRGHDLPALPAFDAAADLMEGAPDIRPDPRALFNGVRVLPSILSADFSRLGDQIGELMAAGARIIHVDVMDG